VIPSFVLCCAQNLLCMQAFATLAAGISCGILGLFLRNPRKYLAKLAGISCADRS
jgi:hypothetical protein